MTGRMMGTGEEKEKRNPLQNESPKKIEGCGADEATQSNDRACFIEREVGMWYGYRAPCESGTILRFQHKSGNR